MSVWGKWKKRWLRCGWFAVTWYLVRVQAAGCRQGVDLIETAGDMAGDNSVFFGSWNAPVSNKAQKRPTRQRHSWKVLYMGSVLPNGDEWNHRERPQPRASSTFVLFERRATVRIRAFATRG
jgi:hypothetical protein